MKISKRCLSITALIFLSTTSQTTLLAQDNKPKSFSLQEIVEAWDGWSDRVPLYHHRRKTHEYQQLKQKFLTKRLHVSNLHIIVPSLRYNEERSKTYGEIYYLFNRQEDRLPFYFDPTGIELRFSNGSGARGWGIKLVLEDDSDDLIMKLEGNTLLDIRGNIKEVEIISENVSGYEFAILEIWIKITDWKLSSD